MSTASTPPQPGLVQGLPAAQLIEQRLEAIDQALVGLLPRHERLAAVAQVETRIRELTATCPAPLNGTNPEAAVASPANSGLSVPTQPYFSQPQHFAAAPTGWFSAPPKKRSRLAVTAGVLGILALGLLFSTPVIYLFVGLVGEILGEIGAYALLGLHVLAVMMTGTMAVGLGLCALWILRRRHEQLRGHGWAITGLCTGPLPVLAGCAAVLLVGFELGAAELFTSAVSVVASDDDSSNSGLTELKAEVERLRRDLEANGRVVPTSSESDHRDRPQAMPVCAPASGEPVANWSHPSVAPQMAEVYAPGTAAPPMQPGPQVAAPVAAQPSTALPVEFVPPPTAPFTYPPSSGPMPQPAPRPAPRPEAPARPSEFPEPAAPR